MIPRIPSFIKKKERKRTRVRSTSAKDRLIEMGLNFLCAGGMWYVTAPSVQNCTIIDMAAMHALNSLWNPQFSLTAESLPLCESSGETENISTLNSPSLQIFSMISATASVLKCILSFVVRLVRQQYCLVTPLPIVCEAEPIYTLSIIVRSRIVLLIWSISLKNLETMIIAFIESAKNTSTRGSG